MTTIATRITADRPSAAWFRTAGQLILGSGLFAFTTVQHVVPVAAWLAPIFLLRVIRTRPLPAAAMLVFLALLTGASFALNGYLDPPPPFWLDAGIAVSYALLFSLPYLADGLIAARLTGWQRSLVFPAAFVTLDWLLQFHPFPNFGSPAYTQIANLPLIQLVSLSGIWGLTFLIAWAAAAVNGAWEEGWSRRALLVQLGPVALLLALVLLYGGLRLSYAADVPQRQAAMITPHRDLWRYPPVLELAQAGESERAAFSAEATRSVDDLFARTEQAAIAGAELIVWAESAAFVPVEDAAQVVERAAALARTHGVYLQIGMSVILRSDQHPYAENRAILFDPQGAMVWDYHKSNPVPVGDAAEIAAGPGSAPVAVTPFGRLSTVICYDASFIGFMQQVDAGHTDVLLVPADDWYQNRYDHASIAVFRAIEHGTAMLRPAAKGLSLATDGLGRTLAQSDYYNGPAAGITLVAIPTEGIETLYSRIGDTVAYAAMVLLIGLVYWSRRNPKRI